ncbi:MAG: Stk1 family PASTA domain-containing Ser/Thr kinase [Actinomycetota bacterium]|nr:Stk1 family PASTA domain-containing Ser/Thr kinase [Actinomycetota bacterium]
MKVMRDLVGETLSQRYRLVARVAGGGMGEVYRGHDLLLDRSVAVKILQPSLASDPELVERFRAEARAAARLTHPNIVGVHDWGCEGDRTYYMVMEYVSGTDLRDILVARGNLEPRQAVEIVAGVCEALQVAHSKGLVHRDVKPENILLNRGGEVKVADFGIAIVADADRTAPGGMIPGTLRYLSPEQARGAEATAASDLWAAGAVLSELLTGLPPLQGAGGDLLQRRAHEPPRPPSSWDKGIPHELDDIVLRACAVDPAQRFGSAAEMAGALRRLAVFRLPESPPLDSLLDQVTGEIAVVGDDDLASYVHDGPARRSRRKTRLKTVFAALLILLLLAGTAGAVGRFVMPQMVTVPDVEGMRKQEAARVLEQLELELLVVDREHDLEVPKGSVLEQSPAARDELEEGSGVEVVMSLGPPKVKLPDVTGMALEEAEEKLVGADLLPGPVTKEFSLEEEGTVLEQSPSEGRLVVGSKVTLVVSRGPKPLEIPDVTGLPGAKAAARVKDAGFEPVLVDAYSDKVEEGLVISTSPGPAEIADEASKVEIYVSIGPEFELIKMPDVRGMSATAARNELESQGLRVVVRRPCGGSSATVVETDPTPGSKIREGSQVALFLC